MFNLKLEVNANVTIKNFLLDLKIKLKLNIKLI